MKMFVKKSLSDKHDVNGDGNDNSDEKDGSHERFFNVVKKK